jgi:phage regulator Rha-like protein
MKTELAKQIKPYFIEELGCEGLSSLDIAEGLQAQHYHVARKIRQFSERLQISIRHRKELVEIGRPQVVYLLPTNLAKMVVAKYENEIGFAYLGFLLQCETIATELTPQLVARVKELEAQLEQIELQLDTANKVRPIKRIAPPKTQLLTEIITCSNGIFGEEIIERHLTRQPISTLNQDELERAKLYMLIRQNEGVTKAIRNLQDKIDFRAQQKLLAESIQKHQETSQVLSKHGLIKKEPA